MSLSPDRFTGVNAAVLTPVTDDLIPNDALMLEYSKWLMGNGSGSFAVLRILRMARIFRVLKVGGAAKNLSLVFEGLRQSKTGLILLIYLVLIFMVIMSSVIYMVEGGEEHPHPQRESAPTPHPPASKYINKYHTPQDSPRTRGTRLRSALRPSGAHRPRPHTVKFRRRGCGEKSW